MNGHDVALWAGVAAFFGSVLAIGIIDIFNPDDIVKFATSLIVAAITAGGVYARQRLDDAKTKANTSANAPAPTGTKKKGPTQEG